VANSGVSATNVLYLWGQLIPIIICILMPNSWELRHSQQLVEVGAPYFHKAFRERRFDKYIHCVFLRGTLLRDQSLSSLEVRDRPQTPLPEYDNTTPHFFDNLIL